METKIEKPPSTPEQTIARLKRDRNICMVTAAASVVVLWACMPVMIHKVKRAEENERYANTAASLMAHKLQQLKSVENRNHK